MDLQNPITFPNNPPIQESQTTPDHLSILSGLILILFGILIGVVGARFFPMSNTPAITPTPTPSISLTPSITSTPTPDPTIDWKLYVDTKKQYEFKYPSEATMDTTQADVSKIMFMGKKQIDSGKTQAELFDGYGFFVSDISSTGSTLEEILQKQTESYKNVCEIKDLGSPTATTIDGHKAITYTSKCLGDYTVYLIENAKSFFEISELYVGEANDQIKYKQTTDQILSTFKFLTNTTDSYTCPANGWVDCMPGPNAKPECSTSAMSWYKANCPNFQGGAL